MAETNNKPMENPPAAPAMDEETRLPAETQEAIAAIERQDNRTFEGAVRKHDTADKLKMLGESIWKRRETLRLTLQQRHALRKQVETAAPQLRSHEAIFALTRPALDDVGEAIRGPAKKAGTALVGWMKKIEDVPYLGAVLSEARYFFGDTVPEATKNMASFLARWGEYLGWQIVAHPQLIFGVGMLPGVGEKFAKIGQDNLQRIAAVGKIEEAMKDASVPPDPSFVLDKNDHRKQWKMIPTDKRGMDWYQTTMNLMAKIKNSRKLEAGTTVKVSLKEIFEQSPSAVNEEQRKMDRAGKAKRAWNVHAVEFTGASAKAKKLGGNCTVSLPGIDSLNDDGTPKTAEAQKLQEALKNLNAIQEIEIWNNAGWELQKNGNGVLARIPAAMPETGMTSLNALAGTFEHQSRAQTLRMATGMKTDAEYVEFVSEQGIQILRCNDRTPFEHLSKFFSSQTEALGKADVNKTSWKWENNDWKTVTAT